MKAIRFGLLGLVGLLALVGFVTDSSQRDRAIQNMVLETAQNEYISFAPTELVGLPDGASVGEAV